LLLGWLILDEQITITVLIGAILIIGGVAALLVGEQSGAGRQRDRAASKR
jgi:drug/metabolite transporter (DMT)-like permease